MVGISKPLPAGRISVISIVLLLIFFVSSSSIFALDCQYSKEVVNSTELKFLPYDSENNQLEEIRIELSDIWNQPAKIINLNSKDLDVFLKLNLNVKSKPWCTSPSQQMNYVRTKELTVPANSFLELATEKPMANHYCDDFKWNEVIEIQYQNTEGIEVKPTNIENKVTVCDGKDDGVSCISSNECGGGYCVEGHCSNTESCFNNECECNLDEIQCTNNKLCVKKEVIPLDVKPKCGLDEECVSGFLDLESGLCAKSPAQISEENVQRNKLYLFLGISFILLFVIGMFIFYSYKNKSKKLDIEKIEAEYKKIQYEIEQKNQDIEKLKAKTHKTKAESKRLKDLSSELTEQIAHFEKTSKDFFIKKYTERYGKLIYLDSKNYIRMNNKDNELLHRFIYRRNYDDFSQYNEVHHIDANHYNNEIWNLIELPRSIHNKINHTKITYGDWISGINELKRIGLSDKDLPCEVTKRLRNQ